MCAKLISLQFMQISVLLSACDIPKNFVYYQSIDALVRHTSAEIYFLIDVHIIQYQVVLASYVKN